MITIKTPEELLALCAPDGGITINGNLRIDCDVPWIVGRQIAYLIADGDLTVRGNLYVEGNLRAEGNLTARGYLHAEGDLYVVGNLYVEGNLRAEGNLIAEGYLRAEGDLTAEGDLHAEGDLTVRGNLTVLKNCAILGDLYWSQMSMPDIRGKFFHRMVLPHEHQRRYWEDRLGMDFEDGCYESIVAQVLPELPRLLRSRKWSETEKWMLTSLRLQDAPVPEWMEKK